MVYLQNSDRSDLRQQMAMEVLASIVEAPFYGDLRTKQQLGYIVSSGIKEERGVRSLVFTVQSGFADAGYLSEKVFAFLGGFEKTLRRMDDAEVNGYIKSLVETKEQKIVRLSDETLLHWGEIVTGKYKYDRTLVEAKTTKELNKAFLVKVWQDVIASGGSRRRVLTSEVLRFRVCVCHDRRSGLDDLMHVRSNHRFTRRQMEKRKARCRRLLQRVLRSSATLPPSSAGPACLKLGEKHALRLDRY